MRKGLISALLGFVFALVGVSFIDGFPRLTLGISKLNAGMNILPVLLGIYALTSIYELAEFGPTDMGGIFNYKIKGFGFSWKEYLKQTGNIIRSAIIGTGIGILPGIGGGTSNILAYIAAKKASRHPEKFGTGCTEGIVASETANNASVGGSMIPLLTMGIPGDTCTAIMIGAFTVHGINVGPLLFANSGDLVYAIFASLLVANVMMLLSEYWGMRGFVKLLSIPKHYLISAIVLLCVVGVFGTNNRVFDVWIMLFFSLIGYGMKKLDFSFTPFIIGFVLGPMAEVNFRRALMLFNGSYLPFVTRPISLVFLLIAFVSVIFAVWQGFAKSRARKA